MELLKAEKDKKGLAGPFLRAKTHLDRLSQSPLPQLPLSNAAP